MAYYLTDPYIYLPKCYPFLNTQFRFSTSNPEDGSSSKAKDLEKFSAYERLKYTSRAFCDKAQC